MYQPVAFQNNALTDLHEVMRTYSFATVVTQVDGHPFASHVPLLLEDGGEYGVLSGHLARANPQWQSFADGQEVLVMFHGPHTYVSPRWYASRQSVPTWNYIAIHAYGTVQLMSEEETRVLLSKMSAQYDQNDPFDWSDLPEAMAMRMLQEIVGIRIHLSKIEGKFKLSQNRSETDRRSVMEKLALSTEMNASQSVGYWMRKQL
ncbi:MAG: FMN-binding negative transcriptional regulator [Pseudomonadota bacterium]